jgi:hypothetical protein
MTDTFAEIVSDALAEHPAIDPYSFALPYLDMVVVFDDGRRLVTHADQRDQRVGLRLIGGDPRTDALGFNRASAWAYLHRTEQLPGVGWVEFDRDAAFVIPLPDDEQTGADPTRTDTGG